MPENERLKHETMEQETLFKYFRGETTKQEEERILAWVERSPENRKEFSDAHVLYAGLALYAPMKAERPQHNRIWRRIARRAARIAAAVALVAGAMYVSKTFYQNSLAEQEIAVSVPAGRRMQITLPDGSQIQLNSGTVLKYPVVFARNSRRVKLSGEALFEVKPDARKPFVVETFASDIQVLGTEFNVLADKEQGEFSTTLINGKIKITNRMNPAETFIMYPHDNVSLIQGKLYKTNVPDFSDLCWTEGLIHLKKMPFEKMMKTFERAFDVNIRIECGEMPQIQVVSGEIRISDGVDYAFHVLQQVSSKFTYVRDDKTNVIVIK